MPRKKYQGRSKRRKNEKRADTWDKPGDSGARSEGYVLRPLENEMFEKYYKGQNIVPDEEWDTFMQTLRKPLPSTFRITGFRREAKELLKIIRGEYFTKLIDVQIAGKFIEPPTCLSWYPDELAWQLSVDKKSIRRSDDLSKLHDFLVSETESGNISRQEAVSMLPPLVMDIKPHHRVLDMCAAPGSKTVQLIEQLHADENIPMPEGFVVANDADNKRCYLMTHQVKRLESPGFMIINHDASRLPSLRLNPPESSEKNYLRYDRVLADVPCSGDGTMRKNPDVWFKWNPGAAHNLHGLQFRILKRGVEQLQVGGRIVYSTCSYNPIENEAVIAHILKKCEGALELLDISEQLPGLKFSPGLSKWKVMARDGEWFENAEDVPERLQTQIRASMFPPAPEEAQSMGLHKCIRILAHQQDTGGFFVAAFHKKKQVPWFKQQPSAEEVAAGVGTEDDNKGKTENSGANMETGGDEVAETILDKVEDLSNSKTGSENRPEKEGAAEQGENQSHKRKEPEEPTEPESPKKQKIEKPKKHRMYGYKEDPFIYLKEDEAIFPQIREFFDLREDFPTTQLMVRCEEGKKRHIYFTSQIIKDIVNFNVDRNVKFINLGTKVLSRSECKDVRCDYRLVQGGMNIMFPYLLGRRVKVNKEDILTLLGQENPYLIKMTEPAQEQLNHISPGGMIFIYEPENSTDLPQCKLVFCGWRGRTSCRTFLQKFERSHYLRLCGSELQVHKKEKKPLEEKSSEVSVTDDGVTATGDDSPVCESDLNELTKSAECSQKEKIEKGDGVEVSEQVKSSTIPEKEPVIEESKSDTIKAE